MELTSEYLKTILRYEPETGYWYWLVSRGRVMSGQRAGAYSALGYLYIKISGQSYIAARLAWLYMTGEWPTDEIDHIDRNSSNDVWENLREADRTDNTRNRVKVGASGYPGVYKHAQNNRWLAQYNNWYIGSYPTIEEAVAARKAYMQEHGLFPTVSDLERLAS
jgi:hypothetical protein